MFFRLFFCELLSSTTVLLPNLFIAMSVHDKASLFFSFFLFTLCLEIGMTSVSYLVKIMLHIILRFRDTRLDFIATLNFGIVVDVGTP
jgi:hypothetical protein